MGLASQSGWYTSLVKLMPNSLAIALFITYFLSWAINLESVGRPKKALYAVSKLMTSNCPEGHGKGDLANGCCCCTRDYAMEGSPTGVH
jgi:hypothetical protein